MSAASRDDDRLAGRPAAAGRSVRRWPPPRPARTGRHRARTARGDRRSACSRRPPSGQRGRSRRFIRLAARASSCEHLIAVRLSRRLGSRTGRRPVSMDWRLAARGRPQPRFRASARPSAAARAERQAAAGRRSLLGSPRGASRSQPANASKRMLEQRQRCARERRARVFVPCGAPLWRSRDGRRTTGRRVLLFVHLDSLPTARRRGRSCLKGGVLSAEFGPKCPGSLVSVFGGSRATDVRWCRVFDHVPDREGDDGQDDRDDHDHVERVDG
jgi:hypothetical protein